MATLSRRLFAEALGTAFLLAAVVGSGIMAESLAGDGAVALLANTIATGAMLVVLVTIFFGVSGAHFNPAVTLAMRLSGDITTWAALGYVAAQLFGGVLGVWAAHAMFDEAVLQVSMKPREGANLVFAEGVATFGLVFAIYGGRRGHPAAMPWIVGLYITSAYWFTASTSFANPAVTVARTLTDTYAGVQPADAGGLIAAQFIGAALAFLAARIAFGRERAT